MPTDHHTVQLGVRVALIVAAALSVALDGPTWLNTTLTALAFVATAGALVRRRELGWADAVAVSAAGLLVVLVILGFALDALPSGLARVPWAIGSGVVAIAAVVWGQHRTGDYASLPPVDRHTAVRLVPWYAAAAVLVAVAIGISVHATRIANRPPLALSTVGSTSSSQVVVQIAGGRTSGRYELVVGRGATARTYGPYDVAAGRTKRSTVSVAVGVPTAVRLRDSSTAKTLRLLVIGDATSTKNGS